MTITNTDECITSADNDLNVLKQIMTARYLSSIRKSFYFFRSETWSLRKMVNDLPVQLFGITTRKEEAK